MKIRYHCFFVLLIAVVASCRAGVGTTQNVEPQVAVIPPTSQPTVSPSPAIPNLQSELLDGRSKTSAGAIAQIDFKNFTYELPRGWQNPDGTAITLTDGRARPISAGIDEKMSDEEKSERRAMRRIGLSCVTAKYLDVTADGEDEAIVILKIETGGSAIPQIVYIFAWARGQPELIWRFRTGDRADGGLKDIRAEGGNVVLELYGQDRFVLGETETGKITGDEEQLCCPTHFTRTAYKWNGSSFLMNKKRLTFLTANPSADPIENLGDKVNAKPALKK